MAVLTKSKYYVFECDLSLTEKQKEKITNLLFSVNYRKLSNEVNDAGFIVKDNIVQSQCFTCEEEAYQLNNKIDAIVAEDCEDE